MKTVVVVTVVVGETAPVGRCRRLPAQAAGAGLRRAGTLGRGAGEGAGRWTRARAAATAACCGRAVQKR